MSVSELSQAHLSVVRADPTGARTMNHALCIMTRTTASALSTALSR